MICGNDSINVFCAVCGKVAEGEDMYQKKKEIERILILFLDFCCITVSFFAGRLLRFGNMRSAEAVDDMRLLLFVIMLAYFGSSIVLDDVYSHFFQRGMFVEFRKVVKTETITFIITIAILYLLHRSSEPSRLALGFFLVINTFLTFWVRVLFKQIMLRIYSRSRYSSNLLVITNLYRANGILENILSYNEWYRQVVGIAITDDDEVKEVEGIPVVAYTDNLLEYIIRNDIDEVFIADEKLSGTTLLKTWIAELGQMGIIVNVNIAEFDIAYAGKKTLNRVGKYAVVTFARNIFANRQLLLKRTLDIVGGLVGMVILGIATIFVAPAIKLDSPGPVFFGQTRIGKNGRKFTFYKFRSMYVDAEERKKELMAQNEVQGLMFKMEDDPRITRVGKFIRKTSIDELPQFWNVLKGDMSLVGTRPPTVDEFEQYGVEHKGRLSMTPGITGLWQISGRSDIKDFNEVVKLDMEYIDNWTIWKDIKILFLTIKVVLTGKGSR